MLDKVSKDNQVMNRIKEMNRELNRGSTPKSTFSPQNNPVRPSFAHRTPPPKPGIQTMNSTSSLYFIDPEDLLGGCPPPPQKQNWQRSNFEASRTTQFDGWRNATSKVMNKERIEEFEHEVVIAYNQPNLESNLQKKPEGTYIIHKGPNNNNKAYPYTIYRCSQGNFGRLQVRKDNIRYDLVRKTYQAEGYGSNHPSLRSLVDANKSLLKREFHERYDFFRILNLYHFLISSGYVN